MNDPQRRAVAWHQKRFPLAGAKDVLLKAQAELGEVSDALLADENINTNHPERAGQVVKEAADVINALLVLGRWYDEDILAAVAAKQTILETPGAHPASLLEEP